MSPETGRVGDQFLRGGVFDLGSTHGGEVGEHRGAFRTGGEDKSVERGGFVVHIRGDFNTVFEADQCISDDSVDFLRVGGDEKKICAVLCQGFGATR